MAGRYEIGDYLFTTAYLYKLWMFYDNRIYTMNEAYEAGILTNADLGEILKVHVQFEGFGGRYVGE